MNSPIYIYIWSQWTIWTFYFAIATKFRIWIQYFELHGFRIHFKFMIQQDDQHVNWDHYKYLKLVNISTIGVAIAFYIFPDPRQLLHKAHNAPLWIWLAISSRVWVAITSQKVERHSPIISHITRKLEVPFVRDTIFVHYDIQVLGNWLASLNNMQILL